MHRAGWSSTDFDNILFFFLRKCHGLCYEGCAVIRLWATVVTMQVGYAVIVILLWIVNPFKISQAALFSVCNLLLLLITGQAYVEYTHPISCRYRASFFVMDRGSHILDIKQWKIVRCVLMVGICLSLSFFCLALCDPYWCMLWRTCAFQDFCKVIWMHNLRRHNGRYSLCLSCVHYYSVQWFRECLY